MTRRRAVCDFMGVHSRARDMIVTPRTPTAEPKGELGGNSAPSNTRRRWGHSGMSSPGRYAPRIAMSGPIISASSRGSVEIMRPGPTASRTMDERAWGIHLTHSQSPSRSAEHRTAILSLEGSMKHARCIMMARISS